MHGHTGIRAYANVCVEVHQMEFVPWCQPLGVFLFSQSFSLFFSPCIWLLSSFKTKVLTGFDRCVTEVGVLQPVSFFIYIFLSLFSFRSWFLTARKVSGSRRWAAHHFSFNSFTSHGGICFNRVGSRLSVRVVHPCARKSPRVIAGERKTFLTAFAEKLFYAQSISKRS